MGYLLRVSEANGYRDPRWMLQYAGMGPSEAKSARPDLSKISKILLCPEHELDKISYGKSSDRSKRSSQFSINNHPLRKNNLGIYHVRICPNCILERGSIDHFWSLRHAIACPEHGCAAIQICPSCKKPLTWNRKGLLVCQCGYDLSNERVDECISLETQGLLRIIYNKLYNKPLLDELTAKCNFPIQGFEDIPLRSLLNIIEKVRQRNYFRINQQVEWSDITVENIYSTAKVFSDWPNSFLNFIESTARKTYRRKHIGYPEQLRVLRIFINSIVIPKSDMRFIQDTMWV